MQQIIISKIKFVRKNCKVEKSRDLGFDYLFDEWVWVPFGKLKGRLSFASYLENKK